MLCLHAMQAEANNLATRLQSFLIDHLLYPRLPSFVPFSHEFTVRGTNDAALLRARLSVLRAVGLVDHAEAKKACKVNITGLTMTTNTMQALSALPDWGGEVSMSVDAWSLPDAAYAELATWVPVSYSTWSLSGDVSAGVLDSMCEGINSRRAGMELPRVVLALRGLGADVERGDHVVVRYEEGSWREDMAWYFEMQSESD